MKQAAPFFSPCFIVFSFISLAPSCSADPGFLRSVHAHQHRKSAGSSSWAAYFQANNDDFNFWSEEWAASKQQLIQLALLDGIDPRKKTGAPQKTKEKSGPSGEDKLRTANSTVKLRMLKSAVEYGESRIKKLEAQEQKSLHRYSEQEVEHKKRQGEIDARFHNKTLILEFYQSNTKEEARQWGSWQKQRDHHHAQYSLSKQIQEDAMKNEKLLIGVYEKSSSPDSAQLKKVQESMAKFCHEAWAQVKKQQDGFDNVQMLQV
jgi:hypothetical protein